MSDTRFEVIGVPGLPMVVPGDSLVDLIQQALNDINESLQDGDVLCVAQKLSRRPRADWSGSTMSNRHPPQCNWLPKPTRILAWLS